LLLTKEEKLDFVAQVNKAADNYHATPGIILGDKISKIINSAFQDLKKKHRNVKNTKLVIKEGYLKNDGGYVREAKHDYSTNTITIYIGSIVYTFCENTTRNSCLPHQEKTELVALSVNTIAHEFAHAKQLAEGRDMEGPRIEDDADVFSQEFTRKNAKKFLNLV
jgi:hypothetical protein